MLKLNIVQLRNWFIVIVGKFYATVTSVLYELQKHLKNINFRSGSRRAVEFFRDVEPFAILIVIVALFFDIAYRYEERTSQAWQSLSTPMPGNSGKIEALEYLSNRKWLLMFNSRVPLNGVEVLTPVQAQMWEQVPKDRRKCAKVDCRGELTHLRKVSIPNAILTGATFTCSALSNADLRGAKMAGIDLRGADMEHADLRRADLLEADLRGAKARDVDLQGAFMQRAQLGDTDMRKAEMMDADLQDANLRDADLRGADLRGVRMSGADLRHSNLEGADLRRADLTEARMLGANLKDAYVEEVDLRGARELNCAQLRKSKYWSKVYRDKSMRCGMPLHFHSTFWEAYNWQTSPADPLP